ncbi:MAG: 50S ribosomal protein L18 [Candidatus Methylomirabilia bacterium]
MLIKNKAEGRRLRHVRVRRKILGTAACPRLSVFRSLRHIYAQLVDDQTGHTLLFVGSFSPEVREKLTTGGNIAAAKLVGGVVATKAKAAGIERVVFDRGGYQYHGRVRALAEAARAGGLTF